MTLLNSSPASDDAHWFWALMKGNLAFMMLTLVCITITQERSHADVNLQIAKSIAS